MKNNPLQSQNIVSNREDCIIERPYYKYFLCSFNFQTSFQIESEGTIKGPCFQNISQHFETSKSSFQLTSEGTV